MSLPGTPNGGVHPFHQKSTCLTQSTLWPYMVQTWSRDPPNSEKRNPRSPPCGALGMEPNLRGSVKRRVWIGASETGRERERARERESDRESARERASEREREKDRGKERKRERGERRRERERERERARESHLAAILVARGTAAANSFEKPVVSKCEDAVLRTPWVGEREDDVLRNLSGVARAGEQAAIYLILGLVGACFRSRARRVADRSHRNEKIGA